MDQGTFLLALVVAAVAVVILFKTAIVVPQQSAFIIERLGKYSKTISAGFHILIPGIERIAYKHSLKEAALDIPEQICITKDNVQVGIDGVLYLQVLDPARASYGIADYTLRDLAARADYAAQRDRQDRARPHVRGARHDQLERRAASSTRRASLGA